MGVGAIMLIDYGVQHSNIKDYLCLNGNSQDSVEKEFVEQNLILEARKRKHKHI